MFKVAPAPPPQKKRRRGLRLIVWLVVLVVVLVVAAYVVVTNPAFIKGVVLPRLGSAMDANVTVNDVSFSPFKQIVLRDLKVQAKDQTPVLTAAEVSVRYHLWDMLRGNLRVDEIALDRPTVELVENPDGSSNLDPLLKALSGKPGTAKAPKPAQPSKPPQINLGRLALKSASVVKIKNYAGGRHDLLEVTNLDLTLSNLKNGQSAALQLSGALRAEINPPDGTSGFLTAAIKSDLHFALVADLKPASATGEAHLDVSSAGGMLQDFSTFGAALNCDMTPTEIRQVSLHFQRGGEALGELDTSGPLSLETMEGRLQVKLLGIDKRLLNLAGAASGIDFGTTTINSTNEITLAKAGRIITATGALLADKFQLTRAGLTTPTLDFSANYDVTVDQGIRNALLHQLTLSGKQNGNPLLEAHLTRPMNIAWGTGANEVGESALNLTVTNLNLADWKPFLGGNAPGGNVNLQAQLRSQQNGGRLAFDINSQIAGFTANWGSSRPVPVAVNLQAQGDAADFKQFNLGEYQLQISRQNQPLLTLNGSGTYDLTDASADSQVTLKASLAGLANAFPQPGASVSSGNLELAGRVTQKQNTQAVTGRLTLTAFSGQTGKNSFQDFGSTMDLAVQRTAEEIHIEKLTGALTQNGSAGGNFDVSGTFEPAHQTVQLSANLSGFNQNGLRPFLEPLLADKKLISVAINGNASVQYALNQSSAIKADLQVTNLLVNDPTGQFPATPLAAKLQIDTTLKNQTADIRQFQIGLTPTARAQNQVQLQGNVDFSKTNAIHGSLKLLADSLDLTSYYDLFAGGTNAGGKASSVSAPQTGPAAASAQEPAAIILPFQNFTVAAKVGQLYLREIAITNFQTAANLDGGHVSVKPFQLVLNGAPVNATADLDLGVPGYKYNLALDADRIPFAPLVNSFAPARQGQLAGALTVHAQISGAGITSVNLQTNLAGQFNIGATNLELSVINVHSSILKSLINVVATIPQLLSNPESGILSIFGQMTGQHSGLIGQLQESPIEVINAQGRAGSGQINLQAATVQSTAFEADAQGSVVLAPVLTNSAINIPITVSVSQDIAKQLNLASGNNSAGATYAPLPQFLTMTGTIGDPKTQIKKTALVGLTVKSFGSGLMNQVTNPASPVRSLLNNLLQHAR